MKPIRNKRYRVSYQATVGTFVVWLSLMSSGLAQAILGESAPTEAILCEREPIWSDGENLAEGSYLLGLSLVDDGCYQEAIVLLSRAIELNPNNSDAYFLLGSVYHALNNHEAATNSYEGAIAALNRVIERNQNDNNAYFLLGIAYNTLSNYEAAIAALTHAIELNPNDGDAYIWRAVAYDASGDVEAAIRDSNTAVQLNSDQVLSDWLRRQRPGEEEEANRLLANGRRLCEPGNDIDSRSRGLAQLRRARLLYRGLRDVEGEQEAIEKISRCGRRQT